MVLGIPNQWTRGRLCPELVPAWRLAWVAWNKDTGIYWLCVRVIDRKADCGHFSVEYGAHLLIDLGNTEEEARELLAELTVEEIVFSAEAKCGPCARFG